MCVSDSQQRMFPTGGLTPPALGLRCAGLPKQKRFLLCTNARFQERRSSARRGCVNRRWCDNNRALFGGRSNRQPRAAGVSPPWFGFALATAAGFCGLITFRPAHSLPVPRLAYASRSWLHARHIACDVRFRFATADVPHGGLTPPALGLRCAGLPKQKRFLLCTNARFRERRSSARRGCLNRRSCDNNRALFGGRSNRQPRAAGVSPPWVREPAVVR
jgi:hypothetical protein